MPPQPRPAIERLLAKVIRDESGCWIFTGTRTPGGYGNLLGHEPNTRVYAHRLAYEHYIGPIPDGMQLDHLCSRPPCCNPAHLEAVTESENHRRVAERRTHCPQGHPYDEANTYHHASGKRCRRCHARNQAAAKRRKRAA